MIDQLGGTPETIGAAITHVPPRPYALMGVAGNLPWHGTGIESSPVIASTQPGRVRGVLARDRRARYTPSANDPVGFANLALFPIIYQDPVPWPYAGSCAIPYIASAIGVGTAYPDIRSGYPNINITWDALIPLIPSSLPTSVCPDPSDQSDYAAIRQQLTNEFGWVMDVRSFISNLQAPLDQTQGSSVVIVSNIADQIANSVQPPATADTSLGWLSIFDGVIAVAAAATGDPVLGTVAASGGLALFLMSNPASAPGGPGSAADKVHAEADQLATQLNDQQLAHLAALDRVETLLVSDAGKLQAVGTSLLGNSAWQWHANTTSDAVNALNATTRQAVYSALLPPTWPVYNLKPDLTHQFSSADVATFGCGYENQEGDGGVTHTFASALPANQFQALIQLVPGLETSTTEVWTFGIVDPYFNVDGAKATVPSTSLTDSLFSTGPDAAAAYPPAWYRSTYNPPSHVTCGNVQGSNVSHQAPPPVIPPPAAAYDGG